MLSDEENMEFENDRTKLLSQNTNEPTRKLHGEIGRFIYPLSDNDINHDDIELWYFIFAVMSTKALKAIVQYAIQVPTASRVVT